MPTVVNLAKPVRKSRLKRSPLRRTQMRRPRPDPADVAWSRAVRERDEHRCRRCGGRGTQAHHIATRSRRPDLIHDLNNGICVDRTCHDWIHAHPKEAVAAGFLSDEKYETRGRIV